VLKKLSVRGFQSIDHADLELGPVSLICGHNRAGKSALLRALHSLCFNRTGDWFIREGEDVVGVNVTMGENIVDWSKERGKSATYTLNGAAYIKTGASVPDEITDALGIRRIDVESGYSVTPQFRMQHDTLLVKESGSRIARILGSLTKLDVVVKAQMLCRRDRDRTKKERDAAEEEGIRLEAQLEGLAWVPDARARIDDLRETIEMAEGAAVRYVHVRTLIDKRPVLLAAVARKADVKKASKKLLLATDLLEALERAREPARRYPRLLAAAGRIPSIEDARELFSRSLEQLTDLSERAEGFWKVQGILLRREAAGEQARSRHAAFEMKQKSLEASAAAYHTACDEADLCEHCPLRQEA